MRLTKSGSKATTPLNLKMKKPTFQTSTSLVVYFGGACWIESNTGSNYKQR
nr:MAG TPA: hypothetical protein [Caudoviricetes sp.]